MAERGVVLSAAEKSSRAWLALLNAAIDVKEGAHGPDPGFERHVASLTKLEDVLREEFGVE